MCLRKKLRKPMANNCFCKTMLAIAKLAKAKLAKAKLAKAKLAKAKLAKAMIAKAKLAKSKLAKGKACKSKACKTSAYKSKASHNNKACPKSLFGVLAPVSLSLGPTIKDTMRKYLSNHMLGVSPPN